MRIGSEGSRLRAWTVRAYLCTRVIPGPISADKRYGQFTFYLRMYVLCKGDHILEDAEKPASE